MSSRRDRRESWATVKFCGADAASRMRRLSVSAQKLFGATAPVRMDDPDQGSVGGLHIVGGITGRQTELLAGVPSVHDPDARRSDRARSARPPAGRGRPARATNDRPDWPALRGPCAKRWSGRLGLGQRQVNAPGSPAR